MVLSTLIIIGLGFTFYFLVYVKQRESEIIAEKMRVLTQVKANIKLLISSEERIIKNQRSSIERDVEDLVKTNHTVPIFKELLSYKQDGGAVPQGVNTTRYDSLLKNLAALHSLRLDLSQDEIIKDPGGLDNRNLKAEINSVLKIFFPGWSFARTRFSEEFQLKQDSATWVVDNMLFKKAYPEFFGKELILRKDKFEAIGIVLLEGNSVTTLFTNDPSGTVSLGDSAVSLLQNRMFEWRSGNEHYMVFNSFLGKQDEKEIYVLGFVRQSELNKQKQEVSVFVITVAIILVTLMILGLPLLKLQVMSSNERLGAKDVFLAAASMVIGPMVVILFFLLFTTNIFTDKQIEQDKLKQLNNKIINDFKKELKSTIEQLNEVKQKIPSDFVAADTAGIPKNPFFSPFPRISNSYFTTTVWRSNSLNDSFRYFNSIFWADRLGKVGIYLSSEKNPKKINSLSHRTYVMDIIRGQGISFDNNTVAFESIRSVTDGNYELGLGIPSGNKAFPVLATSFSSASLMDPVLEDGYGFCLFNTKGRTLFHSEIQRNLNEDFLEETGSVFNPYVRSGVPHLTSVRYMGKNHYMYMQKVPGLEGYFLATFLDKAYTYSPNAISLNTTAEMLIAYLILLSLAYLPLFAVVCKKRKLKQKIFVLYWLRPLLSRKAADIYHDLLLINTFILLYLVASIIIYQYCIYSPELLILSVINAGFFLVITNFFLLSRSFPNNEMTYTQHHKGGNLKPFWIIVATYVGGLFVAKLIFIQDNFHVLKTWDLVVFLAVVVWAYNSPHVRIYLANPGQIRKILRLGDWFKIQGNDQYLSYKLYCTSLIILVSVIPTFIFFSVTYGTEQEILFKQKTVTLKERIDNWREQKSSQFLKERQGTLEPTVEDLDGFIDQMESANLHLPHTVTSTTFSNTSSHGSSTRNTDNFGKWYNGIRVEFDDYGTNSRGFISDGNATGSDWSFNGKTVNFSNSEPTNAIIASIGGFQNLFLYNWWGMAVFSILLIMIIYILLTSVIPKIYGSDFKAYARMIRPRDYHKIGEKLIQVYKGTDVLHDSFNNSFIVGVNATNVYKIFHQLKAWKKEEFYSIELLELPSLIEAFDKNNINKNLEYFVSSQLNFQIPIQSLFKSSYHNYTLLLEALKNKHARMAHPPLMVFIEHFEYAYDNESLNRIKLNILQRLVSNPSIRVVISSEISPTKIFESYEEHIKKATAISPHSLENIEKVNELRSIFKQWQHLLGGFYRITVPFDLNEEAAMPKELKHGQYLNRINSKYKILYGGFKHEDNYILNVQETAYTYYFAVWNSLTKEERYIIYDIAHDQFINTNNIDGIIDLLHKGILIYDYSLRLMNESFTNFVLTKINSDEALERELESNKKGNWSTASAVLILVIISLIIFISLGNVNILQDVNALLASLTGIFALLFRVGGMFVTGKANE